MAISHSSHSGQRKIAGYQSRQACARSRPVTTPSRADSVCNSTAIRLLINSTQTSW